MSNTESHILSLIYSALFLFILWTITSIYQRNRQFSKIPSLGSSSWLISYYTAVKFLLNSSDGIKVGYTQFKDHVFRIPELTRWTLVVTGKLVPELERIGSKTVSLPLAIHELLRVDYTLGSTATTNPYHIPLVSRLTRWHVTNASDAITRIVCRSGNRVLVGLPLCRNDEFLKLSTEFGEEVFKTAILLNAVPSFLRPLAFRCLSSIPSAVDKVVAHLSPIIEERKFNRQEHGSKYDGAPNDFLCWLMDNATGEDATNIALARRILVLNFASLHTTALALTHALYHAAAHPDYAAALRTEVDSIVESHGWSRTALANMHRLDSFLRESMRYTGLGSLSMNRVALQPFQFSDGTKVPKGAYLMVSGMAAHLDPENYSDPSTFDPWRFISNEGKGSTTLTELSPTFLPFGLGAHACPGRHFAACEMKTALAYIVQNYDLKFEGGARPKDKWFGIHCLPDPKAKVMFRKRQM
ncbi:cytochrome P450 [Mucidula mucida]|nr:cytochrome P450 [Mucidula mucida]